MHINRTTYFDPRLSPAEGYFFSSQQRVTRLYYVQQCRTAKTSQKMSQESQTDKRKSRNISFKINNYEN